MKKVLFVTGILSVFLLANCENNQTVTPKNISLNSDFAAASNQFAFDFLKELEAYENPQKNYFVSPLSLNMALGMLLNGASTSSEEEILKTLRMQNVDRTELNKAYSTLIKNLPTTDPKVTNLIANSIWQEKTFATHQSFLDILKDTFAAEIYTEDFSDAKTLTKINNWASENTKGKVPKILEEISADQVMFLINALYFKGDWANQFDKNQTEKRIFNGLSRTAEVDMMYKKDTFKFAENPDFKLLELPYGNGAYSMVLLLPNEKDLNTLIKSLNPSILANTEQSLSTQKVTLMLPKFSMSYSIKLNEILEKMGMPTLFTSGADLSKISPPAGKLVVGFVKQDTYVGIDEVGTEAAAVTTIGIELTSAPMNPEFVCDKPFLFLIRENTSGTVQFIGKIVNL